MAEVNKLKNKIMVLCDCGAVHKITKNETTEELEISSTFKKQEQQPQPKEEKNGTKEKSTTDFF